MVPSAKLNNKIQSVSSDNFKSSALPIENGKLHFKSDKIDSCSENRLPASLLADLRRIFGTSDDTSRTSRLPEKLIEDIAKYYNRDTKDWQNCLLSFIDSSRTEQVCHLYDSPNCRPLVRLLVNDTEVQTFIDTVSTKTLIRQGQVTEIESVDSIRIRTASGEVIPVLGQSRVEIKLPDGRTVSVDAVVVKDGTIFPAPLLIGVDVLMNNECIIDFQCSLNTQEKSQNKFNNTSTSGALSNKVSGASADYCTVRTKIDSRYYIAIQTMTVTCHSHPKVIYTLHTRRRLNQHE